MLSRIPLFAFVALAYNYVVFQDPGWIDASIAEFELQSGASWVLTGEDLILVVSIAILYVEVVKATIADSWSMLDHLLSLMVFTACIVEFLLVPEVATSTFLLITLMTFVDVIAGFSVSYATRRIRIGD